MTALDYAAERDRGIPPLWLDRATVRVLIILGKVVPPASADAIDAQDRATGCLGEGFAEVPLSTADCLTLFTPFAELPASDQARAVDAAVLLLGGDTTADDIDDSIRNLGAAVDQWARNNMYLT